MKQIQNYRENYSVMNVPRNLRTDIFKFNLKRNITDEELSSILKKRTEKLREANEMLKQKIKLMEIEERIAKYELEHPEWKAEADRKEAEEKCQNPEECAICDAREEALAEAKAKEAYERSEV